MNKDEIFAAVIGVGYLGERHARKLAAIGGARLLCVVDKDAGRAQKIAEELSCRSFSSIADLPENVKAAVVAVPTADHFEVADRLLDRGLDLLVEKPITEDIAEARKMVEKARRLGRVLAVGHVERMNPAYRAAVGQFERPFLIEARRLAPLKDRARGVDVVRDLMIHDIDLALQIGNGEAELVSAVGASVFTRKVDVARAHIRLSGGAQIYLIASRLHAEEVREIEVFDSHGCLQINCRDKTARRFEQSPNGMMPHPLDVKMADALEEELKDFLEASRSRKGPAVTGEDGLRALVLADKIVRVIEEGHRS